MFSGIYSYLNVLPDFGLPNHKKHTKWKYDKNILDNHDVANQLTHEYIFICIFHGCLLEAFEERHFKIHIL